MDLINLTIFAMITYLIFFVIPDILEKKKQFEFSLVSFFYICLNYFLYLFSRLFAKKVP